MTIDRFSARLAVSFLALGSWLAPAPAPGAACNGTAAECRDGRFSAPFAEPTLLGVRTTEKCVQAADGQLACKPAAGTLALLADDRLIYFNALEGTENVELSIVAEFGTVSANDQTRVLSFDGSSNPSWTRPTPVDGGANPDGSDPSTTLPATNGGADGALLPTGEVFAVSGADRDEVAAPGLGFAVRQAEIFDPQTETWRGVALQNNPRTYHNTAVLLRDGRVLVGGHAPITTAYLSHIDLSSLGFSPNDGRDPSFEIYSPPYMFRTRPMITNAPASAARGATIRINTPNASSIDSVVLLRRTATTHLVDGDQHAAVLRIVARRAGSIDVAIPASSAVAPSGPYLLFVTNRASDGTRVPSVGAAIQVAGGAGSCAP